MLGKSNAIAGHMHPPCALQVIKRHLVTLLAGAAIFLDVDDLEDVVRRAALDGPWLRAMPDTSPGGSRQSKLEGYIEQSSLVIIFMSSGYFLSRTATADTHASRIRVQWPM